MKMCSNCNLFFWSVLVIIIITIILTACVFLIHNQNVLLRTEGWFLILFGCLLQNLSVEDNAPKALTPLPLNELAPPPSQDELFGELSINQSFIVP